MSVFDYVKSVNTQQEMEVGSDYSQFIMNRHFSYFPDTLAFAAEINQYQIENQANYDFLFNSIRPRNRFTKWAKKGQFTNLELIKKYYQVSDKEAMEISKLLTDEQLSEIEQCLEHGG